MYYLKHIYKQLASALLMLLVISLTAKAQPVSEMKKIFAQAESYYLYEEYEQACRLYLLIETPDNMNIKHKIGVCYLNMPGEKEKAIPRLEEAVKTASNNSKTTSFKEKRAPLDAFFFLARAYMINDDLEKGMNTLSAFKNIVASNGSKGAMSNPEFIEQQIKACNTAIKLKQTPVAFTRNPLALFGNGDMNENPAVSFDGNTIVYTEKRGATTAILYSKKEGGAWRPPVEITAELSAGNDASSCSLNSDGTELFLYKTDTYDGAIYSSTLADGVWSPVKKLNKNINTKFYESHAAISPDGTKLYFTSNREGGYGNLDIYVSERDASGDWGPAINLGATINTPYNEDTPFITGNGNMLYFSSEGHASMGGYDIFRSSLQASAWQTPENIGYPINTTDDDRFYQPADNGTAAYYSMTADAKHKIMFLQMGQAGAAPMLEINGVYSLSDTVVLFDKNYFISLVNRETGDTVDVGYPNKYTGQYKFSVPAGKYAITYTSAYYFSHTVDTAITADRPVITIDARLNPDPSRPMPLLADAAAIISDNSTINLQEIPEAASTDETLVVVNVNVRDVGEGNDDNVLYYAVQIIALLTPVDASYFQHIDDVKIIYNRSDRFYRYITGQFSDRDSAYAWRLELIKRGYPEEIFVKKVTR
ncbi:MAG: hypothetical protein LBV26_07890 [Bacteroidales bacterium]|jgi:tetratricopeptide (TPR) repeat protein|nr:hypothetical protein [Bacteroidales bacterium]